MNPALMSGFILPSCSSADLESTTELHSIFLYADDRDEVFCQILFVLTVTSGHLRSNMDEARCWLRLCCIHHSLNVLGFQIIENIAVIVGLWHVFELW